MTNMHYALCKSLLYGKNYPRGPVNSHWQLPGKTLAPHTNLLAHRTRSHRTMPTVLSVVLSLFGLFLLQLLLDLRRVARNVGLVCL